MKNHPKIDHSPGLCDINDFSHWRRSIWIQQPLSSGNGPCDLMLFELLGLLVTSHGAPRAELQGKLSGDHFWTCENYNPMNPQVSWCLDIYPVYHGVSILLWSTNLRICRGSRASLTKICPKNIRGLAGNVLNIEETRASMDSLTSLNKSVTARFHYLKLTEEKFRILSCDVSFVFQCFSIEHDNTQLVGTRKNYRNREAEMATNSIQAVPNQPDTFDQLLLPFGVPTLSQDLATWMSQWLQLLTASAACLRHQWNCGNQDSTWFNFLNPAPEQFQHLRTPTEAMIHIIHITVAIESSLSPLSPPKSKKVAHHFSDLK